MTLQQLRYADAVASCGSLSEAARRVFVTQPTLTEAIRALEEELRTAIFSRTSRGMTVTREGEEFLASARQILEDVSRIQAKYTGKSVRLPQFAVSTQHYAFAVEAFIDVVRAHEADAYDYTLRETVTSEIVDDVARHRSEIGVLYLSNRNQTSMLKILRKEELAFEELFVARPHVFLSRRHPLSRAKLIRPEQLDAYPFISFEQGGENALYYSEEVMPAIDRKKNIRVRDRATMTNLMLGLNGYTIASGAVSKELNGPEVIAVPLQYDDVIRVGLVRRRDIPLSRIGGEYAAAIRDRVARLRLG
ncbi:MAG: LysR family transcriptional regulator [Kiritimatiellia bacterium]